MPARLRFVAPPCLRLDLGPHTVTSQPPPGSRPISRTLRGSLRERGSTASPSQRLPKSGATLLSGWRERCLTTTALRSLALPPTRPLLAQRSLVLARSHPAFIHAPTGRTSLSLVLREALRVCPDARRGPSHRHTSSLIPVRVRPSDRSNSTLARYLNHVWSSQCCQKGCPTLIFNSTHLVLDPSL